MSEKGTEVKDLNVLKVSESLVKRLDTDRQSLMTRENEAWLVEKCGTQLAEDPWNRDYCNVEAYKKSVQKYKRIWSGTIGEFKFEEEFNPVHKPFFENNEAKAELFSIDLDSNLKARGVLALPKKGKPPFPLVIAQHGLTSSPSTVFGFNDQRVIYHAYGMALLRSGYAVLAPANVSNAQPRTRLHRLCLLLGSTIAGLEVGKTRRLIDYISTLPEVDPDRIAMWGISLGGLYTMFTMPLEPRIKAGIVTAYFNDRFRKMAVSSPLWSCFLDADEEYIWVPGWFKGGFTDSNLFSLICPRPMQIQQGRADGIGWWPLQEKEFEKTRIPYDSLSKEDSIEYVSHDGGHEILVHEGLTFLNRWIKPS